MVTVPPIIAPEDFEQVQTSLRSRSPKRVPPRLVGSPTLLTGIARCGTCGSGMTLRTGKSGRYRYYTCAGCAQKGKTLCPGRSISMAALDGMVLEHLADQLFTPDRLEVILDAYIARSAEADVHRREHLAQARRAHTEAQGRVSRLLELVEQGLMDVNDPTLKERLETAKQARQAARRTAPSARSRGRRGRSNDYAGQYRPPGNRAPSRLAERRPGLPQSLSAPVRRSGDRRRHRNPPTWTQGRLGQGHHHRLAPARGRIGAQFCSGVASPAGFEPTAPGLGILCSIRLSYGDL